MALGGKGMSAADYVREHSVTVQLKTLGLSDEQLDALRFTSKNLGWSFDRWSFWAPEGIPGQAFPLLKAYCALKWLTHDNPPYSRDKDDAFRLLSDVVVAPVHVLGLKMKETQSKRAKKPRGKIGEGKKTLKQMVAELALNPEYRDLSARELWPHFFSTLRECGLDLEEVPCEDNIRKDSYRYCSVHDNSDNLHPKKKRHIGYGQFANTVSEARQNQDSPVS